MLKRGLRSFILSAIFVFALIISISTFVSALIGVDSCQVLDTANEIYVLNTSIETTGSCFTINANNITLDGNGFNITGNDTGKGVDFGFRSNTTIINFGGVINFTFGLWGSSSHSAIIFNNTIISGNISEFGASTEGKGIYLLNSDSSNVSNNNITTYGYYMHGIDVSSSFGVINSNEILTYGDGAVGILGAASTVAYNIINSLGYNHDGAMRMTGNNMTISSNYAYSQGVNALSVSSRNSFYENNTFITNRTGSGGVGVILSSSSGNNTFVNNGISVKRAGSYGIYFSSQSSGNNFTSFNITAIAATTTGAYFSSGIGNTLTNGIVAMPSGEKSISVDDGEGIVTNVTFSRGDLSFDSGALGNITIKWYVDVSVKNSTGSGLQNANITLYNISNAVLLNALTDSQGNIARQTLTEFYQNGTLKRYHTSHTLNTTLSGFEPSLVSFNLTQTNSTNVTVILNADSTSPTISITYPVNNSYLSTTSISIFGTANDSNPDAVIINNAIFGSNIGTFANWNFTNSSLSDATYVINITANDTAGNAASVARTFTVDTTYPLISYGSNTFSDGANISINSIFVNVTVTEANEANITFALYNSTGEYNTTALVSGTRTINWTGLSDGTYRYNVTITDYVNNKNTTQTRAVTLDTASPRVTINSPSDKSNVSGIIQLNATITDTLGVSYVYFNITNSSGVQAVAVIAENLAGNEWNATFNTASVQDGSYNITVFANDTLANINSTEKTEILIDNTPPEIILISPENSVSSTTNAYNFTFNVTDALGVTNCSLVLDGVVSQTLTSVNDTGGTNGIYVTSISTGSHSWSINCTDYANNLGNSTSRTLTVEASSGNTTTSRSSSGGGALQQFWAITSVEDDKELSEKDDLTRELAAKQRLRIKIKGEQHYVGISSLTETTAIIEVSSTPQNKTLNVGEEWKVDVNEDNYYDIRIILNSISNNKANLTLSSVYEEIPAEEVEAIAEIAQENTLDETAKVENKISMWLISIIILVITVAFVFYYFYRKRHLRF